MDRIKYFLLMLLVAMLPVAFTACSDDDDDVQTGINVDLEIPATVVAQRSGDLTFAVNDQKAPVETDVVFLEGSGLLHQCTLKSVSPESVTVTLPETVESGSYNVIVRRGASRKNLGSMLLNVVNRMIDPAEGMTVYGFISTPDGEGVAGVKVSDGFNFAVTDAEGVYQMKSAKKLGYVFYVVPSGYEAQLNGILPCIYQTTKVAADVPERIDFVVTPMANPDNYKVLFLGDMHLAKRTDDLKQFATVTTDINKYRAANSGSKVYAITLGDMTWDLYWYDNKYDLKNYVETMNSTFSEFPVYHTMGNHDNDFKGTDNMTAKSAYRLHISPNYYSFNIGKVHYVVLDNIDCSTYDGTTSRNYTSHLVNEQIEWLRKDLSYVEKSTPVVITMHAPVYTPNSTTGFTYDIANYSDLLSAVEGYTVHFVTGHTHKNYNVTPSSTITGGKNIYEHNVAAVCSDWWWSGHLTEGCLVSTDGSPAGYSIWDIEGTNMKNLYKAAGANENYQFRSYDLNNVSFSENDIKELTDTKMRNEFLTRYAAAYPGTNNNEVLINVWNYNPSWTVTVKTQGGQALEVSKVRAYDPLHIAAMTVKRYNKASVTSTPSFVTQDFWSHFFKVTAPDADTDLVITVKDEFGHTWTENMARPKAFSTNAYKL